MLLYHFDDVFKGLVIAFAVIAAIVIYTFYANMRRADDDPKKQDYHPLAIMLSPITGLFYLTLALIMFIFTAVVYAGFIVVFAILLVAIRRWFIFNWWHKFATAIGDPLLKLNTYLIKSILPSGRARQQARQQPVSF
jgi:membrane protein implicated in regulation of membrane protease activity